MLAKADSVAAPERCDVVVIGAGPAGLSAALNLGRARASVLVVDAGRPRNAATLRSHGFLTRDGASPLQLRKLGMAELEAYSEVRVLTRSEVTAVSVVPREHRPGFVVTVPMRGSAVARTVTTTSLLVASGLRETLPAIPGILSFYGISLFSCIVCDGWELRDRPLALIGHTSDLATRARLIARWTDALTVFTDGVAVIDPTDEAELAERGVAVDRRRIAELAGERGTLAAVRLADGTAVAVGGGFVRPLWHPAADPLNNLNVERDKNGCLMTDPDGRTSVPGLYAAGEVAAPGPQQLIVAAGQGARAAAAIVRDSTQFVVAAATSATSRDAQPALRPASPRASSAIAENAP